ARAVALVEDRLDRLGIGPLAGALRDRALDVVLGHRGVLGLLDRVGERGVVVGVTAAFARGDGDRARELGEHGTTAGVDDRLLVLDPRPLGMSCHGWEFYGSWPFVRSTLRRRACGRRSKPAAPPLHSAG